MRSTQIHFVISLTDCIAVGHHGHCAAELSSGIHCTLHNIMTNGATTNADHATARHLLVRVFIFQCLRLLAKKPGLHIPDLTVGEQLFDLMNLICFVILYPALAVASYVDIDKDQRMPMDEERFAELLYAWILLGRLIRFFDMHPNSHDELGSFKQVVHVSFFFLLFFFRCGRVSNSSPKIAATHMAAALVRYKEDWHNQVKKEPNFTPAEFMDQLGRCLAAFEFFDEHQDPTDFGLEDQETSSLLTQFLFNVASEEAFDFFLPWTPATLPFSISEKGYTRGAEDVEMQDVEAQVVPPKQRRTQASSVAGKKRKRQN
jgi:hypothetical protein